MRVTAVPEAGGDEIWLRPDRLGRGFKAGNFVAPGHWTIRATAPGYEPAEARVRLSPEGPVERPRLVLRPTR